MHGWECWRWYGRVCSVCVGFLGRVGADWQSEAMMKVVRRLLLIVAGMVGGLILVGVVCYGLLRSRPAFYAPYRWVGEERGIANQEAVDKLSYVHNLASASQAMERRKERGVGGTGPALGPETVTLSEAQVNALLMHNAEVQGLEREYRRYATDPVVVLREGRVILAGRVEGFGGMIASVHFEPVLDSRGRMELRLARTMGGRLPLPHSLVMSQLERVGRSIEPELPRWRREARMDSTGLMNGSAVSAALGTFLMELLGEKPVDPYVFVPVQGTKSVPLRVTGFRVTDGAVTFTVERTSGEERSLLLKRIRGEEASGRSSGG